MFISRYLIYLLIILSGLNACQPAEKPKFALAEATIADIHAAMDYELFIRAYKDIDERGFMGLDISFWEADPNAISQGGNRAIKDFLKSIKYDNEKGNFCSKLT